MFDKSVYIVYFKNKMRLIKKKKEKTKMKNFIQKEILEGHQ